MTTSRVVSVLILLMVVLSVCTNVESLKSNFYKKTCPRAEFIVARVIRSAIRADKRNGAAMIRFLFHDCFVEGCDASVLIDSPTNTSEKNAIPNLSLHAFEIIDQAKAAVERICPQVVSCADIIAFAASTSMSALGGDTIDIQGGRFDGLVSSNLEPLTNLPKPTADLPTLQASFSAKGLNDQDLVLLSGAHTVGKSHCGPFAGRLRNFSSTADVDPSLSSSLASSLENSCPVNFSSTTVVNMDVLTPTFFDNRYFRDLLNRKGLFIADSALLNSPNTKRLVREFANNNPDFLRKFGQSLFKMSKIGLKTSANGNIRTNCRSFT